VIFQTFDEKNECFLVYRESNFHKTLTDDCDQSWSYANYLSEKNVEYAKIYAQGCSLEDMCPVAYLERFKAIQDKINAIYISARQAKLNLNEICIYDLMPKHTLEEYAKIKNVICKNVFDVYERPDNYEHMLKITKVITDIKYRNLDLNLNSIPRVTVQDKNIYKLIRNSKRFIDYDMYKTKTGRLSTKRNSFPIMTLAKKYREVLTPKNEWLFELDFNAAELRVLLGLLGKEQPKEDIHDWNIKNIFGGLGSREEAKKRVFAWLYNNNSSDDLLNKTYNCDKIKNNYWNGNEINTIYGRTIQSDDFHAINYIIQSTAADLMFEQMYQVWEILKEKKSFIKFCNHDSIVIDLAVEDEPYINIIKESFSNTRFGKFKINCFGGKNWGDMKELNIH